MAERPTPDAPDPTEPARDLAKRTSRGLSWNLIGNLGANALRIIIIPILGRLLTPHEFGLVAAALTVIAFATFLKDAGVGNALVQRKDLTEHHIEAAFSFSVLFGLGLAGILVLVAPAVARFYRVPELTAMVQVLAILFVFRGIVTVPQAIARRQMQFRALALIDLGSYFVGNLLVVILALSGVGAWSLIAGYLCETVLATIALFALRPIRYVVVPKLAYLRDLVAYGAGHMVGEIANYFAYQGDNMVIGNRLGASLLGLYTRAYDLMRYPAVAFSNVAGSVLFSAFSKIQDDQPRLGRVFRRSLFTVSVLLMPISVALFVLAPELIHLLLGDRWHDAVLPFQILAISMLPRTTFKLGVTIARAAGDVFWVALSNFAYGVMVVGGALFAVRWGISGVATSTAVAVYLNFFVLSYLGLRRTTLSWAGFFAAHVQPLVVAAFVLGAVWPMASLLRGAAAPAWVIVIVASIAGLAAGVLAMVLGVKRRNPDWRWFYDGLRARLRFIPAL